MQNREEWLKSLKPGDRVAFSDRYGSYSIKIVERLTKTQIIIKDTHARFRRDSGYMVGSTIWDTASISPVTDEIKKTILRSNLKYKIGKVDFKSLSNEKIERILAIVSEVENAK